MSTTSVRELVTEEDVMNLTMKMHSLRKKKRAPWVRLTAAAAVLLGVVWCAANFDTVRAAVDALLYYIPGVGAQSSKPDTAYYVLPNRIITNDAIHTTVDSAMLTGGTLTMKVSVSADFWAGEENTAGEWLRNSETSTKPPFQILVDGKPLDMSRGYWRDGGGSESSGETYSHIESEFVLYVDGFPKKTDFTLTTCSQPIPIRLVRLSDDQMSIGSWRTQTVNGITLSVNPLNDDASSIAFVVNSTHSTVESGTFELENAWLADQTGSKYPIRSAWSEGDFGEAGTDQTGYSAPFAALHFTGIRENLFFEKNNTQTVTVPVPPDKQSISIDQPFEYKGMSAVIETASREGAKLTFTIRYPTMADAYLNEITLISDEALDCGGTMSGQHDGQDSLNNTATFELANAQARELKLYITGISILHRGDWNIPLGK